MGLKSGASPEWVRKQVWISAALLAVVFIAANRLSFEHLRWRTDLSEDSLREWAPVTDAILARLEDPLQIELFFPEQTQLGWVQIAKRTNLELLTELVDRSDTPIELVRSDTGRADVANRAQGYGIPATTESGLSGTSAVVERITLGAVLRYRGRERVLPRLLPGALEYTVLDAIYGLTRPRRPRVGVLETPISEGIRGILARLDRYDIEQVSGLEQGLRMPEDLDLLIVPGAIDVGPQTLAAFESHVAGGGRVLVYADRSRSNLDSYDLVRRDSGLEPLLESWGLPLSPEIVWDRATGTPIGNRANNSMIAYPAWPSVLRGADPEDDAERFDDEHPIGASLLGLHARFAHEILEGELPEGCVRSDLLRTSADALDFQPTGKMIADAEGIALEHDRLLVTADPERRALIAAVRGPLAGPDAPEAYVILVGDDDGLALLGSNLSGADQDLPAYNRNTLLNLVDGATAGEELLALRRRRPSERRLADFLAEEREALGLDDRSLAAGASLLQRRQNSTDEALAAERADARRMRWTGLAFALSFAGVLALVGWSRVQRRSPLIVESGEDPARAGQSTEDAR